MRLAFVFESQHPAQIDWRAPTACACRLFCHGCAVFQVYYISISTITDCCGCETCKQYCQSGLTLTKVRRMERRSTPHTAPQQLMSPLFVEQPVADSLVVVVVVVSTGF